MTSSKPTDRQPDPNGPQEQPNAEQPTTPPQPFDWTHVPENPRADPRHMDNIRAEIKKAFPGITDEEIDLQIP